MMAHSDQRGIVSGNHRREPRRESPESMLVGPMGVDDIRPAPPKGVRYELPLVLGTRCGPLVVPGMDQHEPSADRHATPSRS